MSPSEQVNPVRDTGFQQQKLQNNLTELLQKTVKDFSKWSTKKQMAAVSIVGAVLPLLILAVPSVVVCLTLFFAVEAVLYTFKGLKWAGKKAKDGFKYVAEGAVKGAVYSKNKVVDGFGSLKRGAKVIKSIAPYDHAAESAFLNRISTEFTKKDNDKTLLIQDRLKTVFDDTNNNTGLIKSILSSIESKIDSKITNKKGEEFSNRADQLQADKLVNKWKDQKKFINGLDPEKLKNLAKSKSGLPRDNYFIKSIFSEHYDEIQNIIKEEHTRFNSLKRLNAAAEVRGRSKSAPVQPTGSLSESSSLNSVSTDGSEAELLNPKKRKKLKLSSGFSWPIRGKSAKEKTTEIGYKILSKSPPVNIATIGANRNPSQALGSIPVAPPKPPRVPMTCSNSSGNLNSSMNYPEELNPFVETVSTGPDFITNIGDEPLRTRSNSSVSLASTSNFVSTSSRLSDSESANSFSFSRTPTSPAQSFEAWSEENKQCRNSSPSIDSGVSSAGSSTPKKSSSMRDINNHSGPQVPVALNELRERRNSLKKPPNSQTELPKVQHPASKAPDVPSNSSRCMLQ